MSQSLGHGDDVEKGGWGEAQQVPGLTSTRGSLGSRIFRSPRASRLIDEISDFEGESGPDRRHFGRTLLTLAAGGMLVSELRGQTLAEGGEARTRPILACSTTQVADFARQVVGDAWEVRCVLAPKQDPHLKQITPNDVLLVRDARLCLSNGLHLEGKDWMRVLASDAGKALVECTEGVEPLEIEEEHNGQKMRVPDPHAWFSPKNAAVYVRNIRAAVAAADPERADQYRARTELYLGQLRTLDAWIRKEVNAIPPERRILVTSHDAFGYFCQQYGFRSAAPVGWSTGQEIGGDVTYERRTAAIESVRQFGVKAIFVETSVNEKLIRELAREAGVVVGGELYSDSMGERGSAGETYLGMMRENVLTIVQALK